MSIEGITNYEYARMENVRPAWERLERFDYCDQESCPKGNGWMGKLRAFIRKMI